MGLFALLFLPASASAALNPVVLGRARFTVIAPECVRLEYSPSGRFVDAPSLFGYERGARDDDFTLERSSVGIIIDTGRIRLSYAPDGQPFSASNLSAAVSGGGFSSTWRPGMWSDKDLGGTRNLDEVKGPAPMEQGLLSRDGWKVVDDSGKLVLKDGWAAQRGNPELDWYLFGYGHDYKAALRALSRVSGPVPLPRRYALGSWYSRWWPHTAADYRRIVSEYRRHGFPLDVLVVDTDWHAPAAWTGYTWNKELFPDPARFFAWAHAQHLAVGLNEHPQGGVQPFEPFYAEFMSALSTAAAGQALPYDAGDRRYLQANLEFTHEPVERLGLDFWWLDYWSDDKEHPLNRLQWLNELYFRRSSRAHKRGMVLSRWGDWGDHRHPMLFSGDTFILWRTLAFEVPFSANSGNVGAFFWSHDVGGYQGERDGELLARWTQFAAVSAAMRLHSMNKPWLDKRPWTYPPPVEDSMRESFRLRARLMPYVYASARQSSLESIPLLRPLYLERPDDDQAYLNPQEYLFGDAFLAAPIVSSGTGSDFTASQRLWLPEGRWFDWFAGREVDGPWAGRVSEPLSRFPLFARGGIPIPMQPYSDRPASAPLKTLIVRVYPGEPGRPGSFQLYEDDGVSDAYERGAFALTPLRYERQARGALLRISPQAGDYAGRPARRSYRIEFAAVARPKEARVDGKPAAFRYLGGDAVVEVPARDSRRPLTVELVER